MFKKISSLVFTLILSLSLVACNSDTEQNNSEYTIKQEDKIELSQENMDTIETNLKTFTVGTAFDGAEFKIELEDKDLKVSVIKDINDIMKGYNTVTSDETVKSIRKSLIFDSAYEAILEETGLDLSCMQVFIFGSENEFKNNEYYTLKTIM